MKRWLLAAAVLMVLGVFSFGASPALADHGHCHHHGGPRFGFSVNFAPSYSYAPAPVPYYAAPVYVPAPVYTYRTYQYAPYTTGYPVFASPRAFGFGW